MPVSLSLPVNTIGWISNTIAWVSKNYQGRSATTGDGPQQQRPTALKAVGERKIDGVW
jgi:hypothetical protein